MRSLMILVGGVAALAAVPVLAGPGAGRGGADADGDGIVTRAEVEARVGKRFSQMDMNKDGKLDASDREAARAERAAKRAEAMRAREKRGMALGDSNGDGAISLDEMKARAIARFERADSDGDGRLTAAEREAARAQRGRAPAAPSSPEG